MISLFIVMKSFNWVDTYQGLTVPILVNAFGVFFMRQYIISLPDELIEAARVDGAGELTIFFRGYCLSVSLLSQVWEHW